MTEIEVLERARDLITDYNSWSPDAHASHTPGQSCHINDKLATKFTGVGAVHRICGGSGNRELRLRVIGRLNKATMKLFSTIPEIKTLKRANWYRGHRDLTICHKCVLQIFDLALEGARVQCVIDERDATQLSRVRAKIQEEAERINEQGWYRRTPETDKT